MPRRDPKKLARARELRANMSEPEWALWRILRAHRLEGIKFTRQIECGPYHIDFAARMPRLGIELDGESHVGREQKDAARTAFLERQGWQIIRFTNADVMGNAEGVARAILNALGKDFEG
jgi:very-short-patch-repair endonuclease